MAKILFLFLLTCLPLCAKAPDLLLYYHPRCPYCQYVLRHLDSMGKTVPMVDLQANPKERATLKALGGKTQVPCLIIEGYALYESQYIVEWLMQNPDRLYQR